jgi:hypothetical protein
VHHQRTATRLRSRRDDFAALGGQDADRGSVDLREEFPLHAAEQQTNAKALLADGRGDLWNRFGALKPRQQRFHRREFFGE